MTKLARKKTVVVRRKTTRKKKPVRTTALVQVNAAPEKPWLLNQEEVTLIKNSIAKGASDEELKFCLTVARRYKLDPFRQQIWFVKRWDSGADNGKGGKGSFVWTPQVGINGLLFAAARDHAQEFGSVSLPEHGPMIKVYKEIQGPEWAKVKVWKKGSAQPTEAMAWWTEYAPADMDKAPFWRKMPRRMLGKCATALAIRQAYPDLGGLYVPEEMERMGEDYTANGRQIVEQGGSVQAAQAVAQRIIKDHAEGHILDMKPETKPEPEIITITPFEEGRVSLSGEKGLAVVRAEIAPEELADLDIKYKSRSRITHMPAANVFKFIDRAAKCNVVATLIEDSSPQRSAEEEGAAKPKESSPAPPQQGSLL